MINCVEAEAESEVSGSKPESFTVKASKTDRVTKYCKITG